MHTAYSSPYSINSAVTALGVDGKNEKNEDSETLHEPAVPPA